MLDSLTKSSSHISSLACPPHPSAVVTTWQVWDDDDAAGVPAAALWLRSLLLLSRAADTPHARQQLEKSLDAEHSAPATADENSARRAFGRLCSREGRASLWRATQKPARTREQKVRQECAASRRELKVAMGQNDRLRRLALRVHGVTPRPPQLYTAARGTLIGPHADEVLHGLSADKLGEIAQMSREAMRRIVALNLSLLQVRDLVHISPHLPTSPPLSHLSHLLAFASPRG